MKNQTRKKVSLMRGHILRFLEIANGIEGEDWMEVIRAIQKERVKLESMKKCTELGNIYVTLFFLNEILQSILASPD